MQENKDCYLIGEVSNLCNVPIKTLRYYDEIGLLKPKKVASNNNYRYYSQEQILQINIIKDLKLSGFSLKEIKRLLRRDNLDDFKTSLQSKNNEIAKKIKNLQSIQAKLNMYIKGMNRAGHPGDTRPCPDDKGIEVKKIPLFPVVYTRYRCPCNPGVFAVRYSQLQSIIEKCGFCRVGPLMAVFHDHYTRFDYENADIEVSAPIAGHSSANPAVRMFGGFSAVTVIHRGSYSGMVNTYKAAMEWLDVKGYKYVGPAVESYIIDAGTTKYEDNYATEIILPVNII